MRPNRPIHGKEAWAVAIGATPDEVRKRLVRLLASSMVIVGQGGVL